MLTTELVAKDTADGDLQKRVSPSQSQILTPVWICVCLKGSHTHDTRVYNYSFLPCPGISEGENKRVALLYPC